MTDLCEQLERRLAVTVLEVLASQPVAMNAQQQVTLVARDERDLLGEIA